MPSPIFTIAERFGLTFDAGNGLMSPPRAHGMVEGQPVQCLWSDKGVRLIALLKPSLDLGLDVSSKTITVSIALRNRVWLFDSSFDDEVAATADNGERAAHLFNADVRGATLRINAETTGFALNDDRVFAIALQYDIEASMRALSQVARLSQLIQEARTSVPPPAPIAKHIDIFENIAKANGFVIAYTPFRCEGMLQKLLVSISFRRTGKEQFALMIGVMPEAAPQSFGLVVRPESILDRLRTVFGGMDLQTGDSEFDPAFLVRAGEQGRALAVLGGEVRASLLDLRGHFETVALRDTALSLVGPANKISAGDLPKIIDIACSVVESVERESAAVTRGPYR